MNTKNPGHNVVSFILIVFLITILCACTTKQPDAKKADSSEEVTLNSPVLEEDAAYANADSAPLTEAETTGETSLPKEGGSLPLSGHPEYCVYAMDWTYETGSIYPNNSGLPLYPYWGDKVPILSWDPEVPLFIKIDGTIYQYKGTQYSSGNLYHLDRYTSTMDLVLVERETGYYYSAAYPGYEEPLAIEYPEEETFTEEDPYGYFSITDPIAKHFLNINYFKAFYYYDYPEFQAISYEYQLGSASLNSAMEFRFDPPYGYFNLYGRLPSYLISGLSVNLHERLVPLAESLVSDEIRSSLQRTLEDRFPDHSIHLSEPEEGQMRKHPRVVLLPDGSLGALYELRIGRSTGYMYLMVTLTQPEVLFTMDDLIHSSERAATYYEKVPENEDTATSGTIDIGVVYTQLERYAESEEVKGSDLSNIDEITASIEEEFPSIYEIITFKDGSLICIIDNEGSMLATENVAALLTPITDEHDYHITMVDYGRWLYCVLSADADRTNTLVGVICNITEGNMMF